MKYDANTISITAHRCRGIRSQSARSPACSRPPQCGPSPPHRRARSRRTRRATQHALLAGPHTTWGAHCAVRVAGAGRRRQLLSRWAPASSMEPPFGSANAPTIQKSLGRITR